MKENKFKYINNFPLIIMVIVAILIIILVNIYLNFKPYKSIYRTGYLVLSQNMTSNLISNKSNTDDYSIGVAKINYGDSLYKKMDSYYVGVDQKQEIDIDYPVYSSDGLTIYSINDNFRLINEKFEILSGYSGLYINKGFVYNESDDSPADDVSYIFYLIDNSIYINTQIINIKTLGNDYIIPVNSPLNLSKDYLNYYVFDGKKFTFHRISDISYESIVTIGDVELTYEELLLKLNAIKKIDMPIEDNKVEIGEIEDSEEFQGEEIPEEEFIKPDVSVDNFKSDVYFITSNIKINDPSGVITSYPTFEIYDSEDKLCLRKKISMGGEFKISGLNQDKEYKIIGTYKYKNKYGKTMISTFYVGNIKTLSIDYLDEIVLEHELGERYSNKIEIKNLKIKNPETSAIEGVKKVSLNVWKENDKDSIKTFDMSYSDITKFLKGESITFQSLNKLNSNTVYNYEIKFYDSTGLELKSINNSGVVQTSLQAPTVSYQVKINNKTGSAIVKVTTNNKDNVNINNYSYKLLDELGNLKDSGSLNFENNKENILEFNTLNYSSIYKLIIEGEYDLLDGKGTILLESEKLFNIAPISSNIVAWYENSDVTSNSLKADIYISNTASYLSRDDALIYVHLLDNEGNPILDLDGKEKYVKEYDSKSLNLSSSYIIENVLFEKLESDTEYKLKLEVKIGENVTIEKELTPSISTLAKDAYINVIYKKLLGNTLDVSFEVVDENNKIGNDSKKSIIVEVYEGEYNSSDIKKNWIYRKVFNLKKNTDENIDENTNIKLTLEDYNYDNYTIVVKADFYGGLPVQKYINIKNYGNYDETIIVNKNMFVKSELQEQLQGSLKQGYLQTSINTYYNELTSDLYIVDCVLDECNVLGYISPDKSFAKIVNNNNVVVTYLGNINDLNKSNILINNKKEEKDHNIYFVIEKPYETFENQESLSLKDLQSQSYIMNYLSYNTGYEIYNIDSAKDFFDTDLIMTNNETKHYVVTNNIDFKETDENGLDAYLISKNASKLKFNGVIDFQGYSVELYRLSNSSISVNDYSDICLFEELSKSGILKNAVLNYHLDYDGNVKELYGFVKNNLGTIENIIVNIYQKNEESASYGIGALAYKNSGIIRKFAVYLRSNFHTYKTSYIVNYENTVTGKIEDGFVTYYPDLNNNLNNNYKVLLYDNNSAHGTFSLSNSGTIKNCYNLLDIISGDKNLSKLSANAITYSNSPTAKVKNTISVAKIVTSNSYETGPSVKDGNVENISNNYYVDLADVSSSDGNKYNKRISKSVLRNKGLWEFIINTNSSFSITSGYYPTINMNLFMNDYQPLIDIGFDLSGSEIDILSIKEVSSNIENNEYEIEVLVNNRNNYKIEDIKVQDLTTSVLSQTYDEDNLITTVILKLSLESDGIAKSSYNISKLEYSSNNSEYSGYIKYAGNNQRKIDISIFRLVDSYESLVTAISNNENIYLKNDIEVLSSDVDSLGNIINLPNDSQTYTAIFNGNKKYINFNNYNIKRGYFLNKLNGNIYNLGIKNLTIRAGYEEFSLGFIIEATSSIIENIDIDSMNIIIDRQGKNDTQKMLIGLLASKTDNSILSKISVNNSNIRKPDNYSGAIYGNSIGGIVGYQSSGSIKNSYVYNLNISNLKQDVPIGIPALGGIVGEASGATISSCYSTGRITTGYKNVGGILGINTNSNINNNYSAMSISSSNDYVAGIVGYNSSGYNINNNLFIGKLYNENFNEHFYSISDLIMNNNYVYRKIDNDQKEVKEIENSLLEFNNNNSFEQNDSIEAGVQGMPYLLESSFAQQQIKDIYFNPAAEIQDPIIEYILDESDECSSKIDEQFKDDSQYKNACATSAKITFKDGTELDENSLIEENGVLYNEDKTLIIKESEKNVNGENSYTVAPNSLYFNSYELKLKKASLSDSRKINIQFYLKVNNVEDWNKLSLREHQNAILLGDVVIIPDELDANGEIITHNIDSIYKRIINLLGNNKTIKTDNGQVSYSIIKEVNGIMRDVNFQDIKIVRSSNYAGIISYNLGTITNCNFKNIIVDNDGANIAGIVAMNNGYISDVQLDNVSIIAESGVGGLVGYESIGDAKNTHITGVDANNIFISGKKYLGGIVGWNIIYPIKNIKIMNSMIICDGNCSHVGGIVGQGSGGNKSNSSAENIKIYAQGNYIGGFGGVGSYVSNITVKDIQISDDYGTINFSDFEDNNSVLNYFKDKIDELELAKNYLNYASNYIGGICGSCSAINNSNAENVILANKNDLGEYSALNATQVGGIVGIVSGDVKTTLVENSKIYGNNNVGGIIGNSAYYVSRNAAIGSEVKATSTNAGGIIGLYGTSTYGTQLINFNQFMSGSISSSTNAGGIIGYMENNTKYSQNTQMWYDMVFGTEIYGPLSNETDETGGTGGIIGNLYAVPESATETFFRSVFYGNIKDNYGNIKDSNSSLSIGKIQNYATIGAYENNKSIESFSEKVKFVEYVNKNDEDLQGYQINSLETLQNILPSAATIWEYPSKDGTNYFPVLTGLKKEIDEKYYVEIPTSSQDKNEENVLLSTSRKKSYNKNNISYNLYSSDVDKLNIEFSQVDSNTQFYYEIGEYRSPLIPINRLTYTIYYDYKTPIKIHLEQGLNYKEETFKASDLSRKISLVEDKTYYIDSKILYGETKAITGNFVNLYEDKVLTSDGEIYNINTKVKIDTTHSYDLLDYAKPLYEFNYSDNTIRTYYNYSLVNDEVKNYQIIVKNGNLNIINNNLNNKKNSYIIDNYNDSEYQVILQNTNKLYSLKSDIKKPSDFKNSDIEDMYTDILGTSNLAVIKYTNGEVYTFDYRTGEKLFSNFNEDISLLEYLLRKITNDNNESDIPSVSDNKYEEVEILKQKIEEISPEEASQKIYNNNSQESQGNKKYVSVYNSVTSNYDIYSIDDLLKNEELESENNKIYKDYELVRFYRNTAKKTSKFSLNGIIIFSLSILSILASLYLLINRKKKTRDVA